MTEPARGGGSIKPARHPGGSEITRGILHGFSGAETGDGSGSVEGSEILGREAPDLGKLRALFGKPDADCEWTELQFRTMAGRLSLDARFGDGFGTWPRGSFAEGPEIPSRQDIRDRAAAAVEDARLRAAIAEEMEPQSREIDRAYVLGVVLQIDGHHVTPREFLACLLGRLEMHPGIAEEWAVFTGATRCAP